MTLSSTLKLIGKKLEFHRKKKKYSQERLGNEIELSRTSIVNIEKGRHQPSLSTLYKLCTLYNIEVVDILPTREEIKEFEISSKPMNTSDLSAEQRKSVESLIKRFKSE